jgi:hypothetical protein
MNISFTNGYISDYDDFMVFVARMQEGDYGFVYYKKDKTVKAGKIVKLVSDIETLDFEANTVDQIINRIDPKVEYTCTAEFITNNGVFFVAILEDTVFATAVEEQDIVTVNSSYC